MNNTAQNSPAFAWPGRWLLLLRCLWFAFALLAAAVFILAVPARHAAWMRHPPTEVLVWQQLGLSLPTVVLLFSVLHSLFALLFALLGLLIFWRKSDEPPAFFTSLALVLFGVFYFDVPRALLSQPGSLPLVTVLGAVSTIFSVTIVYILPDGRSVPRWARWVVAAWAIFMLAGIFIPALNLFAWPGFPRDALFVTVYGVGLATQIYRYQRVSSLVQRQQTKWMVVGLLAAFLGYVFFRVAPNVITPHFPLGLSELIYRAAAYPLEAVSMYGLPLALSFAIFHDHLWEIDFLINRSLVYGALTVLLGAIFGVGLLVISLLVRNFADGALVAVAVSALVFGAVFQPTRRRLQRFVDQRFYNIQIDYQKTPLVNLPAARGVTGAPRHTDLGKYHALELIGRGGMAEVYRSRHPTLGRPVAIKILPTLVATEPDFRRRFEREARVVAELQHPNIVQLFDFGEEAGVHYMVMEYLNGPDLHHYLCEHGRLSLAQAGPLLQEIAAALDYAHRHQLVHRDIKPSNVMLDAVEAQPAASRPHYRAVLTDFGVAKILGGSTIITKADVVGTLAYIAPEQIEASANVDERADLYSFGVMAYEMLTGKLPFQHSNPGALLIAHLTQPPPDPRAFAPELPESAVAAILRVMAKSPDKRYSTASEFVAALA